MDPRTASLLDWGLVLLELLLAVGVWVWMRRIANKPGAAKRLKWGANAMGVFLLAFVLFNAFNLHLPRFWEVLCAVASALAVAIVVVRRVPSWLLPIALLCLGLDTLLGGTGVSFWCEHFGALGELVGGHFYGLGFLASVGWLVPSLIGQEKSTDDNPPPVDSETAGRPRTNNILGGG